MPSATDIRTGAAGQSEDFERFTDPTIQGWTDQYYDAAASQAAGRPQFRSMRGAQGFFDKPTECPPGLVPSGPNETDPCRPLTASEGGGGGASSGGGGGGGYSGGTTYGGAPLFSYTPFKPPTPDATNIDPAYQFRVAEGQKALEHSALARGTGRTSGTLQDILDWGQQAASQEYGNIYNRALSTYGAQYQGEKDYFAPQYGSWQTTYGGDLSKYLSREANIFNLMNTPAPQAPQWG